MHLSHLMPIEIMRRHMKSWVWGKIVNQIRTIVQPALLLCKVLVVIRSLGSSIKLVTLNVSFSVLDVFLSKMGHISIFHGQTHDR